MSASRVLPPCRQPRGCLKVTEQLCLLKIQSSVFFSSKIRLLTCDLPLGLHKFLEVRLHKRHPLLNTSLDIATTFSNIAGNLLDLSISLKASDRVYQIRTYFSFQGRHQHLPLKIFSGLIGRVRAGHIMQICLLVSVHEENKGNRFCLDAGDVRTSKWVSLLDVFDDINTSM